MDYLSPITSALTNSAMQAKQWPAQMANFEQQRLANQGNWNPVAETQQVNNGVDLSSLSSLLSGLGSGSSSSTPAAPSFNLSYGSGGSGAAEIPAITTNYNMGTGQQQQSTTAAATHQNQTFSGWGDNYLTSGNYGGNPWNNNAISSGANYSYYSGLH